MVFGFNSMTILLVFTIKTNKTTGFIYAIVPDNDTILCSTHFTLIRC